MLYGCLYYKEERRREIPKVKRRGTGEEEMKWHVKWRAIKECWRERRTNEWVGRNNGKREEIARDFLALS